MAGAATLCSFKFLTSHPLVTNIECSFNSDCTDWEVVPFDFDPDVILSLRALIYPFAIDGSLISYPLGSVGASILANLLESHG